MWLKRKPKVKARRLSPRPTNTRLARFVGRMVRRWPLAFASTVKARDAHIWELDNQVSMAWEANNSIHRDMMKVMRRIAPPIVPPEVFSERFDHRFACRIRVEFQPVYMEIAPYSIMQANLGLSEPTKIMAARIADELGQMHGREVSRLIRKNLDKAILHGQFQ